MIATKAHKGRSSILMMVLEIKLARYMIVSRTAAPMDTVNGIEIRFEVRY